MGKEIIIAFSWYGIGGAQRRAFNLADEFIKKGYEVYVLAVLGDDSTIKEDNYFGVDKRINIINIPEYYQKHKNDKNVIHSDKMIDTEIYWLKKMQLIFRPFKKLLSRINFYINSLRKSKDIRSFMLSHPNATVISFAFNIFDRVYFASKGLNNKIIYAETNASDKYSSERFFEQTKKIIRKSDAIVFQTSEQKSEHGLTESKKTFVIHNPIKSNLPQPYCGERKKIVVNFCRLLRQKNLLLLIKAFEKLHSEFSDYSLELYADTADGKNSEYKKELREYIIQKNLTDCVRILPYSSDVHNIIRDYAMFVSSSDYEGISNSMLEAMAIGLPCVCTDCGGGGAKEMIENEENGLLVSINNEDELYKAMKRFISDKVLAENCGKNATKLRSDLSSKKIADQWISVVNNI